MAYRDRDEWERRRALDRGVNRNPYNDPFENRRTGENWDEDQELDWEQRYNMRPARLDDEDIDTRRREWRGDPRQERGMDPSYRDSVNYQYNRGGFNQRDPYEDTPREHYRLPRQERDYGREYRESSGRPVQGQRRFWRGDFPDPRIRNEIYQRYQNHDWLRDRNIEVQVQDGYVTLYGVVGSEEEMRVAERLAEAVPGVMLVRNRLDMGRERSRGRHMEYGPERDTWTLTEGMEVLTRGGHVIGEVRRIRRDHLVVSRPWGQDVFIPMNAILRIGERVHVDLSQREVEQYE